MILLSEEKQLRLATPLRGGLRDFSVVPADSAALLDEAYRLRFRVYCQENQFEQASDFPDGKERDEHDRYSRHALLIYRPTSTPVGTVRLIVSREQGQIMPLMKLLGDRERAVLKELSRAAEISRYAISKQFRRRAGEDQYPDVAYDFRTRFVEDRRVLPQLTLGLMSAILSFCLEEEVIHLCAVMTPALIRLLDGFGLNFEALGPLVSHRGIRQPCFAKVSDLLEGLHQRQPEFYELVKTGYEHRRGSTTSPDW